MAANSRATQKTQGRNPTPRSEKTRLDVITAAASCISEEGYAAASTNRIAERAGVSWGVLQYHFGDKTGLMTAVLEYGMAELERRLSSVAERGLSGNDTKEQLRTLFDEGWHLHSAPLSRAGVEIVINNRSELSATPEQSDWLLSMERRIKQLTRKAMMLVVDDKDKAAKLADVYLIALRGLESTMLQHHGDYTFDREREAVLEMMLHWID
jgi:AcrR family transcriptional regulator